MVAPLSSVASLPSSLLPRLFEERASLLPLLFKERAFLLPGCLRREPPSSPVVWGESLPPPPVVQGESFPPPPVFQGENLSPSPVVQGDSLPLPRFSRRRPPSFLLYETTTNFHWTTLSPHHPERRSVFKAGYLPSKHRSRQTSEGLDDWSLDQWLFQLVCSIGSRMQYNTALSRHPPQLLSLHYKWPRVHKNRRLE